MCVIVYKPTKIKLPTEDTLKQCFKTNSDGAGYMLPLNNKVIIRKGFMTFNDFYNDFQSFTKDNNIDVVNTPIVFHFRITTQGGVQKELCHPYPIADNYEDMRKLAHESNIALAHNGIISLTSSFGKNLKYNDTMTFIRDYASIIIDNDLFFGTKKNKCLLLERLIGSSKLAIMNKLGYVKLIGDFKQVNGIYYSNLNHTYTSARYSAYTHKRMESLFPHPYNDEDYQDYWKNYL